jgi:hypothetical protein
MGIRDQKSGLSADTGSPIRNTRFTVTKQARPIHLTGDAQGAMLEHEGHVSELQQKAVAPARIAPS